MLLLSTRAIKKDVGLIEVTKEEQRSRSFGGDWNGRANIFSSGIVVLVRLRSGYNLKLNGASGLYCGDAQIGALVAERRVRCVIFFWDPKRGAASSTGASAQ